jgi:predicted RNase H-like HicB family nuclease
MKLHVVIEQDEAGYYVAEVPASRMSVPREDV